MYTTTLTFDTLQHANRLKTAGVPEMQAEAHAEAIKDLIENKLATKDDISDLKKSIMLMGYKLTIRLGSMLAGAVAIFGILIPIMLKFLR